MIINPDPPIGVPHDFGDGVWRTWDGERWTPDHELEAGHMAALAAIFTAFPATEIIRPGEET